MTWSATPLETVLGNRGVERLVTRPTGRRLRIVAYHDVTDVRAFRRQVEHVARAYVPVTAAEVVASLDGATLPRRAVWVTFDDGYADVVESGLPVLEAIGVPATLFVCPGAVEGGGPHWFDRARAAVSEGWRVAGALEPDQVLRALKSMPDADRRRLVAGLEPRGRALAGTDQLDRWVAAGMTAGSHTWDHPCLDTCDPEEQDRQVGRARAWLSARYPHQPSVFAYPNGDWDPTAEAAAERTEALALLFDHRLADVSRQPRYQLSRLRLDTAAPIARARAILSGVHPAVVSLRRR